MGPRRPRVVADDELLAAGLDLARGIATKSALAVANAKEVLGTLWSRNGGVDDGLAYENERNAEYCLTSYDAPRGPARLR